MKNSNNSLINLFFEQIKSALNNVNNASESLLILIQNFILREQDALKAFPYLFAIALLFNFVWLGPLQIGVDSEANAFGSYLHAFISQGRWTASLYQKYIIPQPVLPYLPALIYCFFISLSYIIIVKAHNLKISKRIFFLFPIYSSFPTTNYCLEFGTCISILAPMFFLISISSYLFRHTIIENIQKNELFPLSSNIIYSILLQAFLISITIATSQTFILVFMSVCIGILIVSAISYEEYSFENIMKIIFLLLFIVILSLLFYFSITSLFLWTYNVEISYINNFFNPKLLLDNPIKIISAVFSDMWKIYSGSTILYLSSIWASGILVFLGLSTVLFYEVDNRKNTIKSVIVFLALSCLTIPFSLNFFSGGSLPYRSLIAVPYVVWLFALLAFMNRLYIVKLLVPIFISITCFQFLYISSLYAATRQFRYNHDTVLANDIYDRIVSVHENFNRNQGYPVDFFGSKPFNGIYPTVNHSIMGGSIFSWDGGNIYRIVPFMTILGYNNLTVLSPDKRKTLISYYKDMPIWPSIGSVKIVDGITLVKLGNDPGKY